MSQVIIEQPGLLIPPYVFLLNQIEVYFQRQILRQPLTSWQKLNFYNSKCQCQLFLHHEPMEQTLFLQKTTGTGFSYTSN